MELGQQIYESFTGTTYEYDKVGNVTTERYGIVDYDIWYGVTWENLSYSWYDLYTQLYRNVTATYDALGRMTSWADAGSTGSGSAGDHPGYRHGFRALRSPISTMRTATFAAQTRPTQA